MIAVQPPCLKRGPGAAGLGQNPGQLKFRAGSELLQAGRHLVRLVDRAGCLRQNVVDGLVIGVDPPLLDQVVV